MQNQDSNLRLKTSATEDIYLCAALAFDLSRSWLWMVFEALVFGCIAYGFRSINGFRSIHGIIHVIIAVASLSASMAIPGNSIDPQWYMFGIPNVSNSYRGCLIGLPLITNDDVRHVIGNHLQISLVMEGIWLVCHLKQLHMFGIPKM